ncbi:hypothetical protein CGCVW01_v006671 [Colletotrichum viniferum]|nr:hypothetical protein CGCVW01_v006671 [Colletotrichum viniferum]
MYDRFLRFRRQNQAPQRSPDPESNQLQEWTIPRSMNRPLTDIQCVTAASSSVDKALLILAEIQKTNKRCDNKKTAGLENLREALQDLKQKLIGIDRDLLRRDRHQARAMFLRLDRDFRLDVTEPLKTALLDKVLPACPRIIFAVENILEDGNDVVRKLAAKAVEEDSDECKISETADEMT